MYEQWLTRLDKTVPLGNGLCLDLGGKNGQLRSAFEKRGFDYVNLDVKSFRKGEPSLIGDAHRLPFKDASVDLIVSKDTFEHFTEPWTVVAEVARVLKPKGRFVISVPWMYPAHGDDVYRFSPLGIKHLLKNFDLILFRSSGWVFTIVGLAVVETFRRARLGFVARPVMQVCSWLDRLRPGGSNRPASFAAHYEIVAQKQ